MLVCVKSLMVDVMRVPEFQEAWFAFGEVGSHWEFGYGQVQSIFIVFAVHYGFVDASCLNQNSI